MNEHMAVLEKEKEVLINQIDELNSNRRRNKITEEEYNNVYDELQNKLTKIKDELIQIHDDC